MSEDIARLQEQVSALQQQVAALLSETADDRVRREALAWEKQRVVQAAAARVNFCKSRLQEVTTELEQHEPWLEFLQATRKEVEAELATLPTASDRWQETEVKARREVLTDTLAGIDGQLDWHNSSSELLKLATAVFPKMQGKANVLEGRQMLPMTRRIVEELRQQQTALQNELQKIAA